MSVCVYPCSRTLIPTHLKCTCNNQIYRVSFLYDTYLPSIKWMDMALVTQHVMNASQGRQRRHSSNHRRRQYSNPILVTRWSASVIKVSGCLHSTMFKRRVWSSLTVCNNFSLLLLLKHFITKELEYKAIKSKFVP